LAIVLQLKNCSIHYFERAIWCCFLHDVVERRYITFTTTFHLCQVLGLGLKGTLRKPQRGH
jgi:hypothetical protein